MVQLRRRILLLATTILLGVLALGAWSLKTPALEAWYLYKIERGDPQTVKAYGEKLGAVAAPRTIPGLLGLLRRNEGRIMDEDEEISKVFFRTILAIGPEAFEATILALDEKGRETVPGLLPESDEPDLAELLLACLKDPQAPVRLAALRALTAFHVCDAAPGSCARSLEVPANENAIHDLLADPEEELRTAAACALVGERIGDPVVRRVLREALQSRTPGVRLEAAKTLSGRTARLALPELIACLGDPHPEVRRFAAWSLGGSGCEEALPALTKAVKDRAIADNVTACLGNLATAIRKDTQESAAAIQALVQRLESGEGDPSSTLRALGEFGPQARAVVPLAIHFLKEAENPKTREEAASALLAMGPHASPAVPALIEALKDPTRKVRENAAEALGAIGAEARLAVPAFTAALSGHGDDWVPAMAARALGAIGSLDEQTRKALTEVITAGNAGYTTRNEAAEALGRSARSDEDAFRAAMEVIQKDADLILAVARGLSGAPEKLEALLPGLIRALEDSTYEGFFRAGAAAAIGELGPRAVEAVPALERALRDPTIPFAPVSLALWRIQRVSGPLAVARAKEALEEGQDLEGAADLLEKMGPDAASAVPALVKCLVNGWEKRSGGADSVGRALVAIGKASVPALVEALGSDDIIVRCQAARFLGQLGTSATTAIPAIEKAAGDAKEDDEVRREAAKALRVLQASPGEGA